MLLTLIASALMFVPAALLYEQNGFRLKFEHADVVRYNPDYVDNLKIVTFKYNRTNAAVNVTGVLKVKLGMSVKVEVQAYMFLSNEYRQFPIRFALDLCNAMAKNDFGSGEALNCGNFTGCPIKKGTYHICNWAPNADKYPPFIPDGSYMLDIKLFYDSTEITFLQGYGSIKAYYPWELH